MKVAIAVNIVLDTAAALLMAGAGFWQADLPGPQEIGGILALSGGCFLGWAGIVGFVAAFTTIMMWD
jgi:hypothetical protein